MFYKLSNTADLNNIEGVFDAKFRYPQIYKTSVLINGLSEQTLPIITMQDTASIQYAIWGLLPQNYKEGWENFQSLTNTLNISVNELENLDWIKNILNQQRCVIIVTGFFTSYLYKGEVYPFYVYEKNHQPFALAGIYTTLQDGFMSVSIMTTTMENELVEVHNLGRDFPIAISAESHYQWLKPQLNLNEKILENINKLELRAHTISKEFYKNEIVFDTILEPAHYNSLPILSLK